jgi:hypothetical protein
VGADGAAGTALAARCPTRALGNECSPARRGQRTRRANTAPVLTLITQFGGGKTHTLTALYHLTTSGDKAGELAGVGDLLRCVGLAAVPETRVAVFVGNAWDPQAGREIPWTDIARQLAGDKGVEALGPAARTTPPGTAAIARVFQAAGAPVLLLFDEVLNFLNRHRGSADSFHAFIQNLTVATTGTTHGAAVISLPRSQVENDSVGPRVAGQDLQGRAADRQRPHCQRRDRDQRGHTAAACFVRAATGPPRMRGAALAGRTALRAWRRSRLRWKGPIPRSH